MDSKDFIKGFDFNKPDWSSLPEGFADCDLEGFSSAEISKYNAIKTMRELSQPEKPKSRSRVWKSTNGYMYLVSWSNASLLRIVAVKWVQRLKNVKGYRNLQEARGDYTNGNSVNSSEILQSPVHSFGWKYIERLEAQLLDCLRSAIANQEEGYVRPTTSEYLQFLGYAQASLKEAKGDFQRSRQDGILRSVTGSSLASLGINLREWHEALKQSVISKPPAVQEFKGNYRNLTVGKFNSTISSNLLQNPVGLFNYPPVDNLDPTELTFEIFIELVNKTDWQLRRLVESLEGKLNQDQKFYQVEKARIEVKFKNKQLSN